jgi:hypothetical protein
MTPDDEERADLERKLDSFRPGATPEPIADEDVTGIIHLATEQALATNARAEAALDAATQRVQDEAARTRALLASLKPPR